MGGWARLRLKPAGQTRIVLAEPLELDPVDCEHPHVGFSPYPCRAKAVGREEGALADELPGAEFVCSVRRLDDHPALDDHVEARTGLAPFDQHLPGRDHRLRSDGFEQLKVSGVHVGEYRRRVASRPVTVTRAQAPTKPPARCENHLD